MASDIQTNISGAEAPHPRVEPAEVILRAGAGACRSASALAHPERGPPDEEEARALFIRKLANINGIASVQELLRRGLPGMRGRLACRGS